MKQKFKNNLIIIYSCIFILFVFPSLVKAQCERLVWADEFNGTTVDQTKWQFGYGNTGGLHYYTDREENATISDGTLKIIAREESYMGFDYTSALLFIKNKFGWRYGRMEASIKLPGTPGFVPAFWMMPSDDIYGWWPNSGEIDIMEYVTTLPDTIHGTIHTQYYKLFGVPELPQGGTTYIPDAETAFHVYAVEWTEDKIDFLVDDNIYFTFNNQNSGYEKWPFDHPFYIILNLAIGGGWAGPPNQNTVFPQIMEVDYVRVYQEVDDIIISGDDFPQYNNEGVIYSVPDIDEATTYWSLPGNANIISGQNSHQIIVDWDCFGGDIIAEVVSGSCSKTVNYPVKVSSNFLANPGFEKGVKYWMSRVSHLVTASTELTTEEAHSGNFALDINVQTLGSNTWDIQVSQQDLVIESGKQYEFSFWAKADVGNRQINAVIINTNNYSVYAGEIYTLTTNWVQYTLQFTANETATIALNMDMGFTTGRYYLDDFVFTTPELYNQNQLINGDFTDGSNGWNLTTLGGAQATGTVVNGEYAVSIVSGGNYSWDVHLGQENLLIENGKDYVVSFDAYSEAPRAIYAIVGKNADPWTVYCGTQEISLIADKQTYTFSFLMNDITDPQARLGFDVGASSTDVYFDNICIAEESTVQGYTMEQIRNNLLINPPNSGDSSIRELTILALDEILINDSAQTAQSVINFYNLMMEKVASEINDSRNTDVSVWTMYNHGYVIKTPTNCFCI